MSLPRVALLTEIPAPYRIPLFNALAARVDLDVLYLRPRNPERTYYRLHGDELRFRWRMLRGRDVTVAGRWLVVNAGVGGALRATGPNVLVLGGWNQAAFWRAALFARRRRVPVVLWVENTRHDAGTGGPKRLLARAVDAFVVPGSEAEAYVRALRPDASLFRAPNAVDTALFASRLADRAALRAERGLDRTCVLAVGRLAPEKGIDVLVEAARGLDATVVVAGSGSEEARLRAAAPENVRFLGNVDRDDLPAWYAAADVLCLPSRREPWGHTLNEAAAAGLALVASDAAGAAADLIEEGRNGYRVPRDDAAALHGALARIAADEGLRVAMGARSRELSEEFTPGAWAQGVERAVSTLLGR